MGSFARNTPLKPNPVVVDGKSFALNGRSVSYRFHVDEATGELVSDHFGGVVTEDHPVARPILNGGCSGKGHIKFEFPDLGRGDFRTPAVIIKQQAGHTVNYLRYQSHSLIDGKPDLHGLPSTFGDASQATSLVIHMLDSLSEVAADLTYSVFPEHDAIVRSIKITNRGQGRIVVDKLASFSVDLPYREYDMVGLRGEWARECNKLRRRVEYGSQGFGSSTGYSSHMHNPFLALTAPRTTEDYGPAYGFSLVYTGSFNAEVEKSAQGLTRVSMGMNQNQLSWPLEPGEALSSPECVSIYSNRGIGDMSRKLHRLYRRHLIKSKFARQPRPVLLNSWEGLYFNYDDKVIETLAEASAELGVKLFVLDDGWFGVKYPRVDDHAGLGDWKPNPKKFPRGLKALAEKVTGLRAKGSDEKLRFGLWVEPEMVNEKSELYERHPEWTLSAGAYARTEHRNQLVLNLALRDVQEYIIDSLSEVLQGAPITYVKWDNNRAMHESPSPQNYHAYMLGVYRVFDVLTSRFPDILWEGCAAGGGRFDPGILQYFPQVWTSDNMDSIDRIHTQFGTSIAYPSCTMGAHVGRNPCETTGRSFTLKFRAHVALMGGSFGVELDPVKMPRDDREQLPALIALAEKVNPVVVNGDMWRLSLPEESQYPAVLYVSEDGCRAVLIAFQLLATPVHQRPTLLLQGLEVSARYRLDGETIYSGATLMNGGIQCTFEGDYDSNVVFLDKIQD